MDEICNSATATGRDRRERGLQLLTVAGAAAVLTVIAARLPIFQVGGFVYTMIGSYRGGGRFVATVALPLALAVAALGLARRWPVAEVAAGALLVMVSMEPIDHITDAAWRHEHPERFGSLFELRVGFFIAIVAVGVGIVAFAALIRTLLRATAEGPAVPLVRGASWVASVGLFGAVAGQLSESSKAHLWALPLWPQVGRWWELFVTTVICGMAVVRPNPITIASAIAVSAVSAAAAAHELIAVEALEDDPAVSTTATLVGFALVAVALTPAIVRVALRR